MTKGNVTEREFVEKQAVIGALRDEIGATRKKLFETEEALTTMHNKYEEQQKALHAAMEGWTDAANLQFSVVQELRTAEAQLVIVQGERDRLWQHISSSLQSPGSPAAPMVSWPGPDSVVSVSDVDIVGKLREEMKATQSQLQDAAEAAQMEKEKALQAEQEIAKLKAVLEARDSKLRELEEVSQSEQMLLPNRPIHVTDSPRRRSVYDRRSRACHHSLRTPTSLKRSSPGSRRFSRTGTPRCRSSYRF